VVNIATLLPSPAEQNPLLQDPFFRRYFGVPDAALQPAMAAGSGVIVDGDRGLIITNFHVVRNAEAVQVTLKDGFPIARGKMEETIRWLIRRQIGGYDQRIDSVDTRFSHLTFKHVLMPVWISAYRYRNKTYRFLVNGQTGETTGESPLSWIKVTLLVILGLILFYFWVRLQG
jgi:hypothetical protein